MAMAMHVVFSKHLSSSFKQVIEIYDTKMMLKTMHNTGTSFTNNQQLIQMRYHTQHYTIRLKAHSKSVIPMVMNYLLITQQL